MEEIQDASFAEPTSAKIHSSFPLRNLLHKEIHSHADLKAFLSSPSFEAFFSFLLALNESIKDVSTNTPLVPSQAVTALHSLLHSLFDLIDNHLPASDANVIGVKDRFGRPQFRSWLTNARQVIAENELLRDIPEAVEYLGESFGSFERIDYGTGHELHFIAFLYVLYSHHSSAILTDGDMKACVLILFSNGYLKVMRKLQFIYWLEPAGSHGVWGLDDYHFLPFLFGSAQLYSHPHLKPKSIHNSELIEECASTNMYFAAIKFVNDVKGASASLRWHSPLLDDISGAKSWKKVNDGMIAMYKDTVIGKLPIMQHFLFGETIQFTGGLANDDDEDEENKKHHDDSCCGEGKELPTCCIARLPSAIPASTAARQDFHYIPFD